MSQKFAECGIENFEFIVCERVQANPDNSRAMSTWTFLSFKLNALHKETLHWNHYKLDKLDKMLILNLIHLKVDTKLVQKYIRKYMNILIKWILDDFKSASLIWESMFASDKLSTFESAEAIG